MITDYHLMVMVHASAITMEGQTDPADFEGDSFEAQSRRDAVKGSIMHDQRYDPQAELLMKAFEMAGITVQDAARVIVYQGMLVEKKKNR